MHNRTEYIIGHYKLIWDFNGSDPYQNLNNLYLEGVWNMKDTIGEDAWCVAVSIVSEDTFAFHTFNCIRYTMRIHHGIVTLIDTKVTK